MDSPLIAIEWLQRSFEQWTSRPRTPEARIPAKVILTDRSDIVNDSADRRPRLGKFIDGKAPGADLTGSATSSAGEPCQKDESVNNRDVGSNKSGKSC